MDETERFGDALRRLRRAADISQRDLAERIGVDFSYLSKVENNRMPSPAADTIVAICRELKTDPEQLLALAGKLPTKVHEAVGTSIGAQEFLRDAQRLGLTDDEWRTMAQSLRSLRGAR